jgi:ParB family chromosome partitioning protein
MSQPEMKESTLGRGLSDLFGNTKQNATKAEGFEQLHVDLLVPGRYQPRKDFDPQALAELAESIRRQGVLQPILVRKRGATFEIIAGERRWQAAKKAGLNTVPVWIRDINDRDALGFAIIENIQRQDLNLIEEGQAFRRLIDDFNYTHEQLAEFLNKSRSYITNALRLLTLPEKVQDAVRRNAITASHARTMVNMENAEELVEKIEQKQINVRQMEALKKKKKEPVEVAENSNSDLHVLETQLSQALQMPVTIAYQKNAGELKINFKTLEQLDKLVELLNKPFPKAWAV